MNMCFTFQHQKTTSTSSIRAMGQIDCYWVLIVYPKISFIMKIRHSSILFYSIILIFNAKLALAHPDENEMVIQLFDETFTPFFIQAIRSSNNNLYREEFETYETLQRGRQHQFRRKTQNGGGGLRTKYVEFAETEHSRPSYYFPIPFLSPINNKLQVSPQKFTSHLLINPILFR